MPGETEAPSPPEQQDQEGDEAAKAGPEQPQRPPAATAAAAAPAGTASSRVLRGGRERGRAAAAVSRRRKAEYPRRRRSSPSARPADGPGQQPPAAKPPSPAQGKRSPRLVCVEKITTDKDPKEEKEEEDDSARPQDVSVAAARPSRGWRSSSRTSVSRVRDTENTRSSRSRTGSLQLICKSEPVTDPLDYEVAEEHESPGGIR